jgi:Dot/Icm secretion system protein IcmQ
MRMASEGDSDIETLRRFIKIVDETLAESDWQGTHLLRSIEKKIRGLRDEAEQIEAQIKEDNIAKSIGVRSGDAADVQIIYVSVYQQDYNDIRKWERTLKSITDYSITRSVYKEEEQIKEMIRGRPDPNKEGYVAVMVKKEDILKGFAGKPAADKLGFELLNIKEGGIHPAGIQRFVLGEKSYEFVNGSLRLITNNASSQ